LPRKNQVVKRYTKYILPAYYQKGERLMNILYKDLPFNKVELYGAIG